MKLFHRKNKQGSALLITLIFVMTMAAALASYLLVIDHSDQMVSRSQNWNNSLAVSESGVEEALAQLNAGTNYSSNGWSQSGTNYFVSRNLNSATYYVGVQSAGILASEKSTIYSTGTVTVPITGALVSRVVKVVAVAEPLFNVGLGALGDIVMTGNHVAVDSWNSHDPNQSVNGHYGPLDYSGTNGSVASEGGIVGLGNHDIQGNLYLGPSASYTSGSNQVSGTVYSDYNVNFPPVSLPTNNSSGGPIVWQAAPTSLVGGISTHYFTNSGAYIINDSLPIEVQSNVTVTLDVRTFTFAPNTVTIDGGTTASGTIIMYQEAGTVTLGGNNTGGAIGNRPENFYYYGLSGVTQITLSGTSSFVGAIYAPNASMTLNGGGSSNDFEGSAIVGTVTMVGHYDVHYDTALATNGPTRGVIPVSWQEL